MLKPGSVPQGSKEDEESGPGPFQGRSKAQFMPLTPLQALPAPGVEVLLNEGQPFTSAHPSRGRPGRVAGVFLDQDTRAKPAPTFLLPTYSRDTWGPVELLKAGLDF